MKKITSIFISILLTIVFSVNMNANPTLIELNKRRNELNGQLQENRRALDEVRSKRASLVEEIDALNEEMRTLSEMIFAIEEEIEHMEDILLITEEELEIAIEARDLQQEFFSERVRHMYMHGNSTYINAILNAESFTDLISLIDNIGRIMDYEQNMINDLIAAEEAVVTKIEQIEKQKADLEDTRSDYTYTMEMLEEAMDANALLVKELEESEEGYLIANTRFEEEVEAVTQQIVKAQQEEARRREAEVARSRSAQQNFVYTGGRFLWPVPGRSAISSGYVNRTNPISGRREFHTGLDIPAPRGTNVVAAETGVVISSGWQGGFGNTVMIDHGGGLVTLYAHNSTNLVRAGQRVNRGDVIAKVGSTGWSTGNHLHFEVRRNGSHTDPIPFLKD